LKRRQIEFQIRSFDSDFILAETRFLENIPETGVTTLKRLTSITNIVQLYIIIFSLTFLNAANAGDHLTKPIERDFQAEKTTAEPVTPPPLKEPDEAWVEATLNSMTLDEKVGQMIMPVWTSESGALNNLNNYHVGGFIFLANNSTTIMNQTNLLQSNADYPLLFSIDCEAGAGARVSDAVHFPYNMALATTRDYDLAYQQGVVTARECRAMGVHIGLGPVVDLNTEPVNPIIGPRAYTDDELLASRMAEAYINGATDAGLLVTIKHYPGHGPTTGDSHEGLQEIPTSVLTLDEILRTHMAPYRTLVQKNKVDLVMTAHVWYEAINPGVNSIPATLSEAALTTYLREDIGFDGVIISDAFNMQGLTITGTTYRAAQVGVQAGLDIVLFPPTNAVDDTFDGIKDAVNDGLISIERVNDSVRRILRLKSRVGLQNYTPATNATRTATVSNQQHWEVVDDISRKSFSATASMKEILPLSENDNIFLIMDPSSGGVFYNDYDGGVHLTGSLNPKFNVTIGNSSSTLIDVQNSNADAVVIAYFYWKKSFVSNSRKNFVNDLIINDIPVIFLNFGSPFQILEYPMIENHLAAHTNHFMVQEKTADVLTGEIPITGLWPVSLPGSPNETLDKWYIY